MELITLMTYARKIYIEPTKDNEGQKQSVVPKYKGSEIRRIVHERLADGHEDMSNTADKLVRKFVWLPMFAEIKRFFISCDVCQKVTSKHAHKPVPLDETSMIINVPFKRAAIHSVGRLKAENVYTTWYEEAVALRNGDTICFVRDCRPKF